MQRTPTPPATFIFTVAPTSSATIIQSALSHNTKGDSGIDTKVDPKSGIRYLYEKITNFVDNLPFFSGVVLFVGNNTTAAGPTDCKEHGPEMMMRKSGNLF